ncbi:MAG TPA: glycoside hydrolase family 15 protein [Candidatus Paceibacterota bacterium]|nr:glycoside hydrolase family 15 protein [Candidatus Paceibacterota bacterium]
MHIDFDAEIKHHLDVIRTMQTPTGVFTASAEDTYYNKAWLRDIYFIVLSFLEVGEIETVKNAAKSLLTVLVKHEGKISWAIDNKPQETWQYIHARFHPETFEEYWEEWGNSQNDAVGEVLNLLVELELRGEGVIETDAERAVVQKLVDYLVAIEYWHDDDNGIWEENLEVHASSVGSVVAALKKAQQIEWLHVPDSAIELGQQALNDLLPRESVTKFVDLALMTLIYPFAVTTEEQTQEILRNVEYHLVRDKGVLRYVFDRYYNHNPDGYSQEAEWCFGLAWLAIIYAERGDRERAQHYLERSRATVTPDGLIPEAYFSHTDKPNPNTPLAWAESMHVIALHKVRQLHE